MRMTDGGRRLRPLARVAALGLPAAGLPVPRDDPERVRQIAEQVLSRPEFGGESLVERVRDAILERLYDLVDRILSAAGSGGAASIGVGIAFLVLVAALGFLVWRLLRGVTGEPLHDAGGEQPLRPATDWRTEAEAHERAGEWRQALRCRYRALIADLAARGLLDEIPGTTTGEYRGQLRRNAPAASGDFGGATDMFELAWYGHLPTGAAEAARFRDLAGRVLAAAGR